MTRADVFDERKDEFRALARAWDAAVRYVEAHPDDANEIMARHLGGGLEDPEAFAETLKGVGFYDADRNREYFGTPEQPGPIYQTMQHGDRRLVEHWHAEDAGFARRRDQARHLGRVVAAEATDMNAAEGTCRDRRRISGDRRPSTRRPMPSRCGSAI